MGCICTKPNDSGGSNNDLTVPTPVNTGSAYATSNNSPGGNEDQTTVQAINNGHALVTPLQCPHKIFTPDTGRTKTMVHVLDSDLRLPEQGRPIIRAHPCQPVVSEDINDDFRRSRIERGRENTDITLNQHDDTENM
ncbi:uncharacterized protein [Ptychodera flava]|uniref:uncharacterized protein n=1 Tax=Ptychodera flava TaxID=63121 RepID=UPI00396A57FE